MTKTPGQANYEGYRASFGEEVSSYCPFPEWDALSPVTQKALEDGAEAAIRQCWEQVIADMPAACARYAPIMRTALAAWGIHDRAAPPL